MVAKKRGNNQIEIYSTDNEQLNLHKRIIDWTGQLDNLIKEERLFLKCQKIAPVDLSRTQHSHYEILLGIKEITGETISPEIFISAAEGCQRMPEIDRWVIQNVFQWINENDELFKTIGGFSINLLTFPQNLYHELDEKIHVMLPAWQRQRVTNN